MQTLGGKLLAGAALPHNKCGTVDAGEPRNVVQAQRRHRLTIVGA